MYDSCIPEPSQGVRTYSYKWTNIPYLDIFLIPAFMENLRAVKLFVILLRVQKNQPSSLANAFVEGLSPFIYTCKLAENNLKQAASEMRDFALPPKHLTGHQRQLSIERGTLIHSL